eukprot:339426-Prymnesium_polylepis.1
MDFLASAAARHSTSMSASYHGLVLVGSSSGMNARVGRECVDRVRTPAQYVGKRVRARHASHAHRPRLVCARSRFLRPGGKGVTRFARLGMHAHNAAVLCATRPIPLDAARRAQIGCGRVHSAVGSSKV